MKSTSGTSKGSGFAIQGGMFVVRYGTNETLLRREAARAGIEPTEVKHETVVEGITQAEVNRALFRKEIVDEMLAALAGGLTVTAEVDEEAIAALVEARLAAPLQSIEDAIADVPAETVDELGSRLSG